MSASLTITLTMAVPLIGAVLVGLTGRWPNLREAVTVVTAVVLFFLVVSLLTDDINNVIDGNLT